MATRADAADDGEVREYQWISLHLRGYDRRFSFPLSRDDSDRIWSAVSAAGPDAQSKPDDFLVFTSRDGFEVGFAVSAVDFIEFPFEFADGGTSDEYDEEPEGRNWNLRVYFRRPRERYETFLEDETELADVFFYLEVGDFDDQPFVTFVDMDGERVAIRCAEVALVVGDAEAVARGHEEADGKGELAVIDVTNRNSLAPG